MRLERGDEVAGAVEEDAGVPEVVPARNHRRCGCDVRLLAEARERHRAAAFRGMGQLEVAVAGLGPVGDDAEGDERAPTRGLGAAADGGEEGVAVGDQVVGGGNQHQRVRVVHHQRRNEDRGRGVAARGLDHDARVVEADRRRLLRGVEAEGVAGHDQGCGEALSREAAQRCLVEALVADEGGELLGVGGPRGRPQAGSRSAAENDGVNHGNGSSDGGADRGLLVRPVGRFKRSLREA